MGGLSSLKNIGAYLKAAFGVTAFATAGGTGDATELFGTVIDRQQSEPSSLGGNSLAMSLKAILIASATLAAGKKCTYVVTVYHDSAVGLGTKVAIPTALQPGGATSTVILTITDGGGGGVSTGFFEYNLNLESLNRYLQFSVTPDLNAANTDTTFATVAVALGGFQNLPMS